jgi:hypothetical protein
MNTPDPVTSPPVEVTPWYKSKILNGILVAVITQLLAHSNAAALFTPDQVTGVVNWILEGVSALAATYAAQARIVGPVHPIAGTKTAQNAVMASARPMAPPESGALVATATFVSVEPSTPPGAAASEPVTSKPKGTQT